MLSVRITLEVFSSFDIASQEIISFTENTDITDMSNTSLAAILVLIKKAVAIESIIKQHCQITTHLEMSINSQGQKKKKDSSQFLSNIFTRMIFIERNIKDTPFMNIRACIVFFFFLQYDTANCKQTDSGKLTYFNKLSVRHLLTWQITSSRHKKNASTCERYTAKHERTRVSIGPKPHLLSAPSKNE